MDPQPPVAICDGLKSFHSYKGCSGWLSPTFLHFRRMLKAREGNVFDRHPVGHRPQGICVSDVEDDGPSARRP